MVELTEGELRDRLRGIATWVAPEEPATPETPDTAQAPELDLVGPIAEQQQRVQKTLSWRGRRVVAAAAAVVLVAGAVVGWRLSVIEDGDSAIGPGDETGPTDEVESSDETQAPDEAAPPGEADDPSCPATEGEELDLIETFFAAYHRGDHVEVERLLGGPFDTSGSGTSPSGPSLFDSIGVPHTEDLYLDDVDHWVDAGQRVNDRFEIVDACVFSWGVDGDVRRRNDGLAASGFDSVVHNFKAHVDDGVITNLVLYRPSDEDVLREFCSEFAESMQEFARSQCEGL